MRSASEGLKPLIRGQRTPIGNDKTKVVRAFCHWFDENGRGRYRFNLYLHWYG